MAIELNGGMIPQVNSMRQRELTAIKKIGKLSSSTDSHQEKASNKQHIAHVRRQMHFDLDEEAELFEVQVKDKYSGALLREVTDENTTYLLWLLRQTQV